MYQNFPPQPATVHADEMLPVQREIQNLDSYRHIVVMFSGGKDSLACLLYLIDTGVPRERLEVWHHLVDGREDSSLMDWPVTEDYCRRVAKHLGVKIRFSWKEGGFEREMLRAGVPTAPIHYETPEGTRQTGGRGPAGTRLRFPQVSANLAVRWCSAYLKIDVAAAALRGDPRFLDSRTLVVTGERAEESAARARYKPFEPHRADRRFGRRRRRHIDHWRPVLHWPERQVWDIIRAHGIRPHPAYRAGFGRVSCMTCIFGAPDQWATVRAHAPERFRRIADYEAQFGVTIHRKRPVTERVLAGTAYAAAPSGIDAALCESHEETVAVPVDQWELPAGAFGEKAGPT